MNISGQIYVYGLVDTHGNEWVGAVDEPAGDIMVYGLYDTDDQPIYFDAEAYHLRTLAKDYALKYGECRLQVNVDVAEVAA